jgi:uncharacterized protein
MYVMKVLTNCASTSLENTMIDAKGKEIENPYKGINLRFLGESNTVYLDLNRSMQNNVGCSLKQKWPTSKRREISMNSNLIISREAIAEFCRHNHIRKLALFGSALREDFQQDSDVDLLVEFEPKARIGLIRLAGMELQLSELFGRKVDLRTPQDLSRYFREEVLQQAEILHEAQ